MASGFASPQFLTGFTQHDDFAYELPSTADPLNLQVRYPSTPVVLMSFSRLPPAVGPFGLSSPVTGVVRAFELAADDPLQKASPSVDTLLEVSPLPFSMAGVLRSLQPGLPTFYLACRRVLTPLKDLDGKYIEASAGAPGQTIVEAEAARVYMGVVFQNRVSLAPWSWIRLLAKALADDPAHNALAASWSSLAARYDAPPSPPPPYTPTLRVLNGQGAPLHGATFNVRVVEKANETNILKQWDATIKPDDRMCDLERAERSNESGTRTSTSLIPEAGELTKIKLSKRGTSDSVLPVHALYETGDSAPPKEWLTLSHGLKRGHIQVSDIGDWFAANRLASGAEISFYTDSHVRPIVDGEAAFRAIVSDLLESAGPGRGAHLSGWEFREFALHPGLTRGGTPVETSLVKLAERIRGGGGDIRLLVTRHLVLADDVGELTDDITIGLLLAAMLGASALILYSSLAKTPPFRRAGFIAVMGGFIVHQAALLALFDRDRTKGLLNFLLEKFVHKSTDLVNNLNALGSIAHWCEYPAKWEDNPLFRDTPGEVDLKHLRFTQLLKAIGVWNAKIQAIKRSPDPSVAPLAGPTARDHDFVAYVGGVDIVPRQLDNPGHHGQRPHAATVGPLKRDDDAPYPSHNVHARVTGPAALKIFQTWDERYVYEKGRDPSLPDPAFALPSTDAEVKKAFPPHAAKHIVQVGRTFFKPQLGATLPRPFPPDGESTIYDTLLKAIAAAREYIYIEDQYFTPNWSRDVPDSGVEKRVFLNALLKAAEKCQRLVILVPTAMDQPFGNVRRREIFRALRDKWQARVVIGAPVRRPYLHPASVVPHQGRCVLKADVSDTESKVEVGPLLRVPDTPPFWLWIEGELMLCIGYDGTGEREKDKISLRVVRRFAKTPSKHKAGAAVTMSQLQGIYVHSKVMMIDDLFLSVGSANLNRRGFFHDGEINAFAIPQQMKAAPDNPARQLRTALWAEHLGLPPAMGAALVEDPIAAFALFSRTRYQGNRFAKFEDLDPEFDLPLVASGGWMSRVIGVGKALQIIAYESIWNTVSDPTSRSDPDPLNGPHGP